MASAEEKAFPRIIFPAAAQLSFSIPLPIVCSLHSSFPWCKEHPEPPRLQDDLSYPLTGKFYGNEDLDVDKDTRLSWIIQTGILVLPQPPWTTLEKPFQGFPRRGE